MTRTLAGILAAIAIVAGTGCASIAGDLAHQAAGQADDLHAAAEWAICKAISVGAWVRAYGADPQKAAAWRTLCASAPAETPAKAQP